MANWIQEKRSGFRPDQIVEKLDKITSIDPSTGAIVYDYGYPDYSFDGLITVLSSMVGFSNEVPITQSSFILRMAVRATKAKGTITQAGLLREIQRGERSYLDHPQSEYVMVTYISANAWFTKPTLANRRIKNATITFSHRLPGKFRAEREKFESLARDTIEIPQGKYQVARVRVSARSASEAVQLALESLDLLRAIWTFAVSGNSGLHPRRSGGSPTPLNDLVLGPLHTLHKSNGERATEIDKWWFDPHYKGPMTPFDVEEHSTRMYRLEKVVRKKIRCLNGDYGTLIESALVRYARSLDNTNWNNTFLGLWSILEDLTNTGQDGYKKTIERVTFLFEETEYHKQILNHLRTQRNEFVHAGTESTFTQSETLAYQTKYYVDELLGFHIFNNYGFKCINEAAQFLDYPTSSEHLKKDMSTLQKVMKFRRV